MLEYCTELNKIIVRSKLTDTKDLNHDLLTYLQMKKNFDHNLDQNNMLKLGTLNLRRNNLSLMNRTTDLKRLIVLISQSDVPRIKQLISSCLKSHVSVNTITERITQAINGKFKKKFLFSFLDF